MRADLAIGASGPIAGGRSQIATIAALAAAGFRRYSTYRQAMVAALVTNSVFGFLRCYVLLAAASAAHTGTGVNQVGGYDPQQLATYCWASQGLIGVVLLWGWTDLADRIRTGDVVADLLRPLHPVLSYLSIDLGRAAFATLTRLAIPVLVGAVFFDLYRPHRLITAPLFLVSVLLGVLVSFGCRYLLNASAFWLLDIRGLSLVVNIATSVLTGLSFPLHFLPGWLVATLWTVTPFPSVLQAPLDVLVERGSTAQLLGVVGGQAVWVVIVLGLCRFVQHRAEGRIVIQGG